MENQNNLHVTEQAADALRISAKWSMFLAIIGFVFLGLLLFSGLATMAAMSSIPGEDIGFNPLGGFMKYLGLAYVAIAVIYFFPFFYLYKYAKGIREALTIRNSETLAEALENLKSHHKFLGIFTIVLISFYLIVIIIGIATAATLASQM